jgi:hypothetical protein
MRYVIVIAAVGFFVIWDGLYNGGQFTDMGLREIRGLFRMVGV